MPSPSPSPLTSPHEEIGALGSPASDDHSESLSPAFRARIQAIFRADDPSAVDAPSDDPTIAEDRISLALMKLISEGLTRFGWHTRRPRRIEGSNRMEAGRAPAWGPSSPAGGDEPITPPANRQR